LLAARDATNQAWRTAAWGSDVHACTQHARHATRLQSAFGA